MFYLLGVVEVVAIIDVSTLGWVKVVLQLPEVILCVFSLTLGLESVLH